LKCLEDNEQFDDMISTDECSVQMEIKACEALLLPQVGTAEAERMCKTSPHGTHLGWHLKKRSD